LVQIFEFGEKNDSIREEASFKHSYVLHPVTGSATYTKLRLLEARRTNQALQKAAVDLDDVTLSLSKVIFMLRQAYYCKFTIVGVSFYFICN
jgi:vacuolar protein sorting-associated protein 13A/C